MVKRHQQIVNCRDRFRGGSVEQPFDSKFHFQGIFLHKYGEYYIYPIFSHHCFLFNTSLQQVILLPLSMCKIAELVANSVDPDQMPHSAASDLGLHC